MSPLLIKIRTIIIPYIILFAGTVAVYMLLQWALDVTHLSWNHDIALVTDFWLPLIMPLVLVIAVLHRRLSILNTGRAYPFYIILAYSILYAALDPAGSFIQSAPYKLHSITDIDKIDIDDPERYYSIKRASVNDGFGLVMPDASTRGTHIHLSYYTVTPFKTAEGNLQWDIWLGEQYNKEVKARGLSKTDFDIIRQDFLDSVNSIEHTGDIKRKNCYYEVVPAGTDRYNYLGTMYSVYNFTKQPIILRHVCKPFSQRYLPHLLYLLLYSLGGLCIFIFTVLITKVHWNNWYRYNEPEKYWMSEEPELSIKQRGILQYFIPAKDGLYITPILISLNVIYFIILVLAGKSMLNLSAAEMDAFGGNSSRGILSGQLWRLVFNSFLHSGFAHIFGNMLSLALIGSILEPYIGKKRFLIAYFACSFAGSINSLLWKMASVSAGASIPIAGMYGVLLVLLLSGKIHKRDRLILAIISGWKILNLILLFYEDNIDNGGHIGGYITGCIVGGAIILIDTMSGNPTLKKRRLSH